METWINLLQTFGLATFILIAMGFSLWRVLVWVGRELVIPVRDRLLNGVSTFVTRLDASLIRLEEAIRMQGALLARMESGILSQSETLRRCQRQAGTLEDIGKRDAEAQTKINK